MASTYLTRTQVAGNRSTFTQSFWFKLSNTGDQAFISTFNDSSNYNYCYLDSSTQQLNLQWKKSGSVVAQKNTTRKFTDPSAWYHIVYAIDTTQASGGDRIKLYVNGVLETDFSSNTAPGQITTEVNDNGTTQYIGSVDGSQQFFDGSMSYVAQIDGTAELPTVFGETDATTGEWKVKTTITPSVALGNNGFLILKDGNTVTDSSTNSNNFAVAGGTLTKTEDSPSNNFATLNPLDKWVTSTLTLPTVLSNGNNEFHTASDGDKAIARTTLGMLKGKYYCEVKIPQIERTWIGICNKNIFSSATNNFWTTNLESGFFWYGNGTAIYNANNQTTGNYGGYGNANIVMMALDMDNYAWYLGINGAWLNSGNPESGSTKTGSVTGETNFGTNPLTNHGEVFFMVADSSTAGTARTQWNFGNGYFGTTAIASEGTNTSGNGKFEYNVPSGYTALSTKGLNL